MFRPSISLETSPLRNGGFPLCNRGFTLYSEGSLRYLLQPYSHHHPDFDLATTSPPSILLLQPTHIHQIPSSTTSMGGFLYCSRYPIRNSYLYLNHSSKVPIQNATLFVSIERLHRSRHLMLNRSLALVPWICYRHLLKCWFWFPTHRRCSSLYGLPGSRHTKAVNFMVFVYRLGLSVFVQVFWCIKGFQAVKVKIAHYVFVGMPLQRWVIWKPKIWQGPYGVVISLCNLFMFWLSFNLLIKVDIIETTYSRNVLAAVVILIWIDKKTMDSLLFVIMDRGRKIFQCRELGYRCWFSGKMLAFSQSTVSIDHVFVVFNGRNFLLSIWSLSKSYYIIFIVICLELFFVEWIFIYRKKKCYSCPRNWMHAIWHIFDRGSLSINLRYKWSINLSPDQVSVYYSFNCFFNCILHIRKRWEKVKTIMVCFHFPGSLVQKIPS